MSSAMAAGVAAVLDMQFPWEQMAWTATYLTASYVVALVLALALPETETGNGMGLIGRMDVVHHCLYTPVISYLATTAYRNLPYETAKDRFQSNSWESWQFFMLFVCHSVLHMGITLFKKASWGYKWHMLLHHTISIMMFVPALDGTFLKVGGFHHYGTLDGCCEVTGIFLNLVYLFKLLNITWKPLLAVNGIILWLTWIVLRLCMFPFLMYGIWRDEMAPEWPETSEGMRPVIASNTYFYLCFVVNSTLLILSIVWFIPIHKGMMKAVLGGPKTTKVQ
jgi:hypothetical protein